jgi:uncharacterized protein (TIGR02271 family)
VTLREEHVHVERRPVTETTSQQAPAGDLLQDRTIEMREVAEEAVVQKVAQVREEVVVSKSVEERTEQIDDTIRKTEVDVQEGIQGIQGQDRSAFGGFGGSDRQSSPDRSSAETSRSSREPTGSRN